MTQWNREPWGRYSSTSRRRPDAPGPQRDRRSLAACSTRTGTKARTRPASRRLCSSWTTSSMCSRGRAGNFTESRSTTSLSARNSSFTPIGKVSGFRRSPSRLDEAAAAECAAGREHTTPAVSSRGHPRNTAPSRCTGAGFRRRQCRWNLWGLGWRVRPCRRDPAAATGRYSIRRFSIRRSCRSRRRAFRSGRSMADRIANVTATHRNAVPNTKAISSSVLMHQF